MIPCMPSYKLKPNNTLKDCLKKIYFYITLWHERCLLMFEINSYDSNCLYTLHIKQMTTIGSGSIL